MLAGDKMKISVFIPFHNEEKNIAELVERVKKGAEETGNDYELIMVDDGSNDNSFEEAKKCMEANTWITLLQHRTNFGLTEAMKTGFDKCTGDIIVFLPSDLESHPDEDIPVLVNAFNDKVDIVCGKRLGRGDGKLAASKAYNFVSKMVFGTKLSDMNWIKAFRRSVLPDLELRSDWHRFIVQILISKGYRAIEVDVKWYPRKSGKSHYGLKRMPIAFFDALSVRFLLSFTKAPMRFFGGFGALQMLASFTALILMLVGQFILGSYRFGVRPMLYFIVSMFLSGLIFFFMGFIAELIVSVKDEIRRKK